MHCGSGPSKRSFWVKKKKKKSKKVQSETDTELQLENINSGALTVFLLNNWDTAGKEEVLELDFYVCISLFSHLWVSRMGSGAQ